MRPAGGFTRRCSLLLTVLAHGRRWRGVILCALLSSACSPMHKGYDSTARTIRLHEAPLAVACERGTRTDECVLLLKADWEALVIDYKAKCLQLGGSPVNCQTEPRP
jgi:hypothetical protein